MVLTGREWSVSTDRAARGDRALCRLLLLSGIMAVAWLAGVGVAHGETGPGGLVDRVLGPEGVVEEAGRSAEGEVRVTGTAARAATDALTGTVVPQAAELPETVLDGTGVSGALEGTSTGRVVEDTARTVDGTARGAGRLVDSVATTGREVVGSADGALREGDLVGGVAGLTEPTGALDALGDTVTATMPADLPLVGGPDTPAAVARPAVDRAVGSATEAIERAGRAERTAPGFGLVTPVGGSADASAGAVDGASGEADTDRGERIRLIAGGSTGPSGADATGASAPSFPTPGTAGFLTPRAAHLAPRVQRVALPGDPTLVVRDAADDPSFSPD
ncbi:hypothetical protein ACOQFV_01300 [Nocardiopsis changdeensis]|uniref:Uncharacterized protein n=1 Tax=Nocardiopsis changdeensis TaxID=2831969 RepID=A0ABX8BJ78_9ACTN|nr:MULTISPECIES: hypothetical protein [Nocardiopsis]QUX22307.1 hypothetical protein KGD84_28885 [Nocardiopsis changdeensis]QYX38248.1 hypothetical protein K1J57_06270 [Nocardiopsis sp. MT53]